MSIREIDLVRAQSGSWRDDEINDAQRHMSPNKLHDLRHIVTFQLAKAKG